MMIVLIGFVSRNCHAHMKFNELILSTKKTEFKTWFVWIVNSFCCSLSLRFDEAVRLTPFATGRDGCGKFFEKLIISNVEKSELICRLLGSVLSARALYKVQRVLKGRSVCLIIDYCLPQHRQCIMVFRWQIFNMMVFQQLCALLFLSHTLFLCVTFFLSIVSLRCPSSTVCIFCLLRQFLCSFALGFSLHQFVSGVLLLHTFVPDSLLPFFFSISFSPSFLVLCK